MPLWSVQEWRVRIGSCWCALGCLIKTKICKKKELFKLGIPWITISVILISFLTASLLKCGDVEVNPGPGTQTSKQIYETILCIHVNATHFCLCYFLIL